jgi:hypothetical protein
MPTAPHAMKLTEVTEQTIMPEALGGEEEEGDGDASSRKKTSGSRSKAA